MVNQLDPCSCGRVDEHNCAHFLSNYLITKLKFKNLDVPEKGGPINARCAKGRPLRAAELRDWIKTRYNRSQLNKNGWYFFYERCLQNGRGHVGMISIKMVKDEKGKIIPKRVAEMIQGLFYEGQFWEIEYYFYQPT